MDDEVDDEEDEEDEMVEEVQVEASESLEMIAQARGTESLLLLKLNGQRYPGLTVAAKLKALN